MDLPFSTYLMEPLSLVRKYIVENVTLREKREELIMKHYAPQGVFMNEPKPKLVNNYSSYLLLPPFIL